MEISSEKNLSRRRHIRQLKVENGFSSDDATIRHLINGRQSLCLLKMLASSAEAAQLGDGSVTETGNENFGVTQNIPVASAARSAENLLIGATGNVQTEQQSDGLVSTSQCDLHFSGEQPSGSQYEITSPSRFHHDFKMTATTYTPARSHKRPQLSR